jgi:hypothetical protein
MNFENEGELFWVWAMIKIFRPLRKKNCPADAGQLYTIFQRNIKSN